MRFPAPFLAVLLLSAALPAYADGIVDSVVIRGLDDDADEALRENIRGALSLSQVVGQTLGDSRLEYLLADGTRQARDAMQPFGYYSPTITFEAPRTGDHVAVVVEVDKGEPVRVRNAAVAIDGPGSEDRYLQEDLAAFQPGKGQVLDHTKYELSKANIARRLSDRGYFDADFTRRRVEVTRADHAADVDLEWASGRRYDMGKVTFHQSKFQPGLLDKLVYWDEGSYYHQVKLDRLRESLTKLDYFSAIDIQPDIDSAVDGRVPIEVNLKLAKRSVYTYGLSYGTDSGAGVRLGLDRRYLNSRGHKLNTQLDYAQKRKTLTTQYRIPAFAWLDGWYSLGLQATDEQTDYIDLRHVDLVASRTGQVTERLNAAVSLHALRERWTYDDPTLGYQYSTLTYPEISAEYVRADDRINPRSGFSANLSLRGGVEGAGSDASFAQLHGTGRFIIALGKNDRILTRGEFGTTSTDALVAMPPSLRFFAGGDRSIRGYAYREVGPRLDERNGNDKFALGAKNVITGSLEYEHYFGDSPWGGAVFVDSGSAFDDTPDWKTGVGFGVRWRSPVGPVRVDIGHGLNDPDSQFQLHINIGADL